MQIPLIDKQNFFSCLEEQETPWQKDYLCMYSSQWHGITVDPELMVIPIDDHLVHRGDGVFDVIRCVNGKIYQMERHLQRLERSAKAISLNPPPEYENIRALIKHLVLIGGEKDCLIRIVLSRGPGSFSTNPFDCPSSQIYVNIIRYKSVPSEYYRDGVAIVTSHIPIKKSFFATIKSCNYLPNVLIKMGAIEANAQFAVALDEDGFLAEGSIENVAVLSVEGILEFPGFERTLSGITAERVFQLAEKLVLENIIREVKFGRISLEKAYQAREIFLTGTSVNIIPVISYDGNRIGKGCPGPIYSRLSNLFWEDMTKNRELLTEIDWEQGR
jgi:branched-subunit amino acid aminotransferase/4-amino-4-deoxychorismate lyase